MRNAASCDCFPYTDPTVCYIAVDAEGHVGQVDRDKDSILKAYQKACDQTHRLYAVWPGKYKSDLFEIDDLAAFARAFDIVGPETPVHRHDLSWHLSSIDDGKSTYAMVEVVFNCGCELTHSNIKRIASELYDQMGWQMTTSRGISCHTNGERTEYILRVLRRSLGNRD